LAERIESLAHEHEKAGQYLSAGRKYLRSSIYYFAAERMISHRDTRKVQTYRQALAAFKKGLQFRKEPVEWVEVPFKGKSLPALFSKAPVKDPAPCMVHFDGFDMMKEILYLRTADDFRRRGISLLLVDHPGVGEALRLRHMPSGPDTEVPAASCVDYLETRSDVDARRVGIVANSLGGYYAPRAAAFEKRFKCCVAWGAIWEFGELISKGLVGKGGEPSVPGLADHTMWVFGKDTVEEAIAAANQLTLEGIAEKITCPLLVFHGENDRQVPLWRAEKTIEAAVNAPVRKLKVFTLAEGGAEHCQADNYSMAVDYMADWVAEILGGNPQGI
jgi:dienelactone hydrolase